MVSVNLACAKVFNRSIGLPLPSTLVRLREENGDLIERCELPGEIEIKGPQLMSGYWGNKEETTRVLQDGWLKSGDIGQFDKQGFLHLVDRKKDMILVSGFNVYPSEIEGVIAKIAGISEGVAIAVDDKKTGERVKL
ncbi:long-chain fatty acid--CoA ligase, partial [Psychromonas sp. Urea-02u-13]